MVPLHHLKRRDSITGSILEAIRPLLGSLVAGAVAGLLFVWGLRRIEATRASNLTFLEPLVATVSAWAFLGEALTVEKAVGGFLILVGAAVVVAR